MSFTVDTGMLSIFITVILAILALATAWGALEQKVKRHDKELEFQKKEYREEINKLHQENREDHQLIFEQLRKLNEFLRGKK